MAVVRTNPLPNGLYWIDLFSPTSSSPATKDGPPLFLAWVQRNRDRVLMRRTEEFPEPAFGGPKRTWILFEVVGPPAAFPFGLGFPTVATDLDTPSSSATLPTPPDPLDWLTSTAGSIEGLVLLYILWELSKRR